MVEVNIGSIPRKVGRPKVLGGVVKRFTIACNADEYFRLKDRAEYEGLSMAALVRKAVAEYLDRRKIYHE